MPYATVIPALLNPVRGPLLILAGLLTGLCSAPLAAAPGDALTPTLDFFPPGFDRPDRPTEIDVAGNAEGRFVVIVRYGRFGDGGPIYGRTYHADGTPISPPRLLLADPDDSFEDFSADTVAMAPDGSFWLLYTRPSEANLILAAVDLVAQRYSPEALPMGEPVRVTTVSATNLGVGGAGLTAAPVISVNADGRVFVAWSGAAAASVGVGLPIPPFGVAVLGAPLSATYVRFQMLAPDGERIGLPRQVVGDASLDITLFMFGETLPLGAAVLAPRLWPSADGRMLIGWSTTVGGTGFDLDKIKTDFSFAALDAEGRAVGEVVTPVTGLPSREEIMGMAAGGDQIAFAWSLSEGDQHQRFTLDGAAANARETVDIAGSRGRVAALAGGTSAWVYGRSPGPRQLGKTVDAQFYAPTGGLVAGPLIVNAPAPADLRNAYSADVAPTGDDFVVVWGERLNPPSLLQPEPPQEVRLRVLSGE
jgi:hypothetical protein